MIGVSKQAGALKSGVEPCDPASRRRRPGDPQREKKEETRKKLLSASQFIFERYPYNLVSVEMIADQAGISRTTFYRHFDGKLQVVLALFDKMAPGVRSDWIEILGDPDPSAATVLAWTRRIAEAAEANRGLVSMLQQIDATEAELQPYTMHFYEEILELMWPLGRLSSGRSLDRLKARSRLLLVQFDQFQYQFAGHRWATNREEMIEAMAELIHEFLHLRRRELMGEG